MEDDRRVWSSLSRSTSLSSINLMRNQVLIQFGSGAKERTYKKAYQLVVIGETSLNTLSFQRCQSSRLYNISISGNTGNSCLIVACFIFYCWWHLQPMPSFFFAWQPKCVGELLWCVSKHDTCSDVWLMTWLMFASDTCTTMHSTYCDCIINLKFSGPYTT